LALKRSDLAHSWTVLKDYGNMSSATALFVLERALASGAKGRHLLGAFGLLGLFRDPRPVNVARSANSGRHTERRISETEKVRRSIELASAPPVDAPAKRPSVALVVAVVLTAILEVLDITIVSVATPHMLGSLGAYLLSRVCSGGYATARPSLGTAGAETASCALHHGIHRLIGAMRHVLESHHVDGSAIARR
jgi:hypothetical protein